MHAGKMEDPSACEQAEALRAPRAVHNEETVDLRASSSSSSLRARSASAWSRRRCRSRRPLASCARRSASCLLTETKGCEMHGTLGTGWDTGYAEDMGETGGVGRQ